MSFEALTAALALALACAPLLARALAGRPRLVRIGVLILWAPLCIGLVRAAVRFRPAAHAEASVADRPIREAREGFTTSGACQACHPHEHATWHRSYHRTMTQVAGADTVRAPFTGDQVVIRGRSYRMTQDGDAFFVSGGGPGAASLGSQGRVVLTTGSHHQQAFWIATGDGRKVAAFPWIYHLEEKRWMPLDSAFLSPPGMSQIAEHGGEWNVTCIKCHATQARPRLDVEGGMDTRVLEFGIACEACHGPGEEHARLNSDPRHRYRLHMSDDPDASIVNPSRLPERLASQVCGQCHGVLSHGDMSDFTRWADDGFTYRPGEELSASRAIVRYSTDRSDPVIAQLLDEDRLFMRNRFWNDGMIRLTGREYNGLIESPCYEHGDPQRGILTCLSCHEMHQKPGDARPLPEWADDQLKPALDSDAACLQCHKTYGTDGALAAHTHHKPASTGSRCQNCHMPHTTYGLLRAMRSHTIDSPDVAVTVHTGRPNACNLCHLDASLGWTAGHLRTWYGIAEPDLSEDERSLAASIMWLLRGDAGQRALVAWHMGWRPALEISGADWIPPYLSQLLLDDYDAVRMVAHRALRGSALYADLEYDFLGSRSELTASVRRVHKIWAGTPVSEGRARRGDLLMGKGHEMQHDRIRQLLSQRDNSPIYLNE